MALFSGYQFDPASYQGGGLLPSSWNARMNVPQGQFPDQLPANAQPTQGQMPGAPMNILPQGQPQQQMQPPAQQGNPLLSALQGFTNAGSPMQAIGGLIQGLVTGEAPTYGSRGRSSDIMEYEYARRQGFKGGFQDWIANKRAGAGEYSLTPVYGTDAEGNTVLIQPGKSGEAIQTKLPAGVKISDGVEKVDLGPEWGFYSKRTGALVGRQPKDIVGKEAAEERGKGQGQAELILPQVKTQVDSAFRVINDLRNHPGLEVGTGLNSKLNWQNWVPGQPGYDFQVANKQAMGKSFMAARESLKGAGQVTDFEGAKGEQSIAALETAQSKAQYLKMLDELERMMNASYADLQRKAGKAPAAVAPAATKSGASIDDLLTKYGSK